MHRLVLLNDHLLTAESASVSAVSSSVLFGRSVFTTIAVRDGKPFLWEKHWKRLKDHAGRIELNLKGFDADLVKASLDRIMIRNEVREGRARVTFIGGGDRQIWNYPVNDIPTQLLIMTAEARTVKDVFRLQLSSFPVNSASPLAGIKSGNYLENLIAWKEARSAGFDECVRLNERGEIVSAAMANIFWVKDGGLFTPALESGCLAGTTRELLTESLKVREVLAPVGELELADEVFLTSSGIGVCRAQFGEDRMVRDSLLGELLSVLHKS